MGTQVNDSIVKTRRRVRQALGTASIVIAMTGIGIVQQQIPLSNATAGSLVPAPIVDEPAPSAPATETAVLAGGCFWGVQGLFQHVNGVTAAESGYAGGTPQTANYTAVSTGKTGHAETVRITYDPTQVTYGQLLRIFFASVEDPAQVTGKAPDTQYRSTIFAQDDTQKRVAESYIAQLNRAAVFSGPIVTTVSPKTAFFPAERYHQDFMYANPTEPYIASSEMPKLADLKRVFPSQYREQPALMFAAAG